MVDHTQDQIMEQSLQLYLPKINIYSNFYHLQTFISVTLQKLQISLLSLLLKIHNLNLTSKSHSSFFLILNFKKALGG